MVRAAAFATGALAIVTVSAAALAAGSASHRVGTATAVCPARSFNVAFDPKRQVVVTDGQRQLASASFTARAISSRCRRIPQPRRFVGRGLGAEIRTRTSFRCLTTQPIRIHVNPIRNRDTDAVVGSALNVGIGSPFRVIVAAVVKNRGDPYASTVRRAAVYCKLGA